MAILFSSTLFLSALLLFWVQPLLAKMLLPYLGGSPSVWNTCMLFFQVMLLAGYGYAHWTTTKLKPKQQAMVHLGLLALAALFLPFGLPASAAASLNPSGSPVLWLFGKLLTTVGLPFFVLSATAPLLQHWFTGARHEHSADPYFLYAASNGGSLAALLGFSVLFEPLLRLAQQGIVWAVLYGGLFLLLLLCAVPLLRGRITPYSASRTGRGFGAVPKRRIAGWIVLAFVPSSLMLGVTTHLTMDIATVPLLWIITLSLYLLTFILVFARRSIIKLTHMERALPVLALALTFLMLVRATEPAWVLILVNLAFFFVATMVCHGRLAADRPGAQDLTVFYLCLSIGGVLGGVFNALVAPMVFKSVIEYPLMLVLCCFFLPAAAGQPPISIRDMEGVMKYFGGALIIVGAALVLVTFVPSMNRLPATVKTLVMFGGPLVACYFFSKQPIRFTLSLGGVFLIGALHLGNGPRVLAQQRNFFGVSRVVSSEHGDLHLLFHGNTMHGRQFLDAKRRCEPLSYYHRGGPLGQVFEVFNEKPSASTNFAAIGLGAGAVVAYGDRDQRWTFYEIDPVVVAFASNTNYFEYLYGGCSAAKHEVVLGDARLRLRDAAAGTYGMIILDAFSSDSIPMHLVTREAVELYLSKLAPDGILVWHISNRYLDLAPIVGDLAGSLKLVAVTREDLTPDAGKAQEMDPAQLLEPGKVETRVVDKEYENAKDPSQWVVLARSDQHLRGLDLSHQWKRLEPRANARVWTDDFSNILGVFRWW